MRGRRGRPPKAQLVQEPTTGPVRGLRPRRSLKPKVKGSSDEDYVTPKRGTHHHSTRGRRKARSATSRGRGRGRGTARGRGRRSTASGVVYDDHESDEDDEDAVSLRSEEDEYIEEPLTDEEEEEEEEEAINDESDYLEELDELDEDDASYCTESSHGSNTGTDASSDSRITDKCAAMSAKINFNARSFVDQNTQNGSWCFPMLAKAAGLALSFSAVVLYCDENKIA